jgi:hypothetical protein
VSEGQTGGNYSELIKIAKGLADSEVVFRGTFVNSTPWWGGNYKGNVLELEGEQNPSYAYVTMPEAKSITGKTVWFMRTVRGDGFLKEMGILDDERNRQRSKVSVIVRGQPVRVDLVSGKADGKDVLYLKKKDLKTLDEALESKGGKVYKLCRENEVKEIEEFLSVFCIPRVFLRVGDILSNKNNKGFESRYLKFLEVMPKLPVKPNTVSFEVEVRAERGSESLAMEFTKGLLFTMYYLGIGNGGNRGFGRFKLIKVDKVSQGITTDPRKVLESFTPFKRDDSFPGYKGKLELVRMKGGVEKVLKCVGEATTKIKWKTQPRSCGKDLDTWVLGLPRRGKDSLEGCNSVDTEEAKQIAGDKFEKLFTEDDDQVNVKSGYISKKEKGERKKEGNQVNVKLGYSFFIGDSEVSRRQSYVVLSVNEEGGEHVVYALKFIPDKPDTEVVTKGFFVGLHGHKSANNCKIEVKDVLSKVDAVVPKEPIEDAINRVKHYLVKCRSQGGSSQGGGTGRGQGFGGYHRGHYPYREGRRGR